MALRSKSSVSNTTTEVRKDLNLSRLAGKLASLFYCPADPRGADYDTKKGDTND